MWSKLRRSVLIMAATGSTLLGTSCMSQLRDAAAAGALDFVSGTTTDALSAMASLDAFLGDAE